MEDAAGSIQDQDNTTKAQSLHGFYLIPAMHFLSTLESKNTLWAQEKSDKQSLIDRELP